METMRRVLISTHRGDGLCLRRLARRGLRRDRSPGGTRSHEDEHAGHVIPAHKPKTFPAAVHRLRELNDQFCATGSPRGAASPTGRRALQIALDIANWLPEIAADSDMPEAPWNEVNTRSARIVADYQAIFAGGTQRAERSWSKPMRRSAISKNSRRGRSELVPTVAAGSRPNTARSRRSGRTVDSIGWQRIMFRSDLLGRCAPFPPGFLQATPTILVGLAVAADLPPVAGTSTNTRRLFGCGTWGEVPQAWLIGMLLPICSLGVIPVAREMRRARDCRRHDPGVRNDCAVVQPAFAALRPDLVRAVRDHLVRVLHAARGHGGRSGVGDRLFPGVSHDEPALRRWLMA